MRIAIFSDNFYPELSGISDSIILLAKELAKRGHRIKFYVPHYSRRDYKTVGLPEKELGLGEKIEVERFCSFHVGAGTGQARMVIPTGLRSLSVRKFKPDIIHTQLFFGVGLEALIAARKLKIPLVGTNHTAIKEYLRYSPLRAKWLDDLILKYVNWYYSKCALTTAPSRSVIDEMRSLGFRGGCHVISNPIDTETFRPLPSKNWLKEKYGFREDTIVHAGRLAAERNIDVIIKAMALVHKKIPKIELALAGKGAAEEQLRGLAKSLNIENNVHFLGFLDKPALAEVYNASQVFVITSTSDTQSMVMMQAMAAGLPVIGVKARALPEYINAKNGILIEPNDEKTLAGEIIYLLKNPATRKKLADGAHAYAKNFSASKIAEEWEKIYEKTVKEYNRRDAA